MHCFRILKETFPTRFIAFPTFNQEIDPTATQHRTKFHFQQDIQFTHRTAPLRRHQLKSAIQIRCSNFHVDFDYIFYRDDEDSYQSIHNFGDH